MNPSSHVAMALSLLSSSLSQARSCSHSSTITTDIATTLGGEQGLHRSRGGDQRYDKKHAHTVASTEQHLTLERSIKDPLPFRQGVRDSFPPFTT
jgi:hypothetical protein